MLTPAQSEAKMRINPFEGDDLCDNGQHRDQPDEKAISEFSAAIWLAIQELLKSRRYAADVGCDPWQFAIEIDRLEKLGVTSSDLRWLVRKGYLQHARELTSSEDRSRQFQLCENLAFTSASNFSLTEAAIPLLRDREAGGEVSRPAEMVTPQGRLVPHWDSNERILLVGRQIVKEYRVRSPNQEAVLSAFEEEGWPRYVDDPLSPTAEQNPKQRLRDTIKWLNSNQKCHLIRFSGDGTGERVGWRLI